MYTFEQLMSPVWGSEIIYDESLTMVKTNGIAEAPLLFLPKEVLSVTSADKTIIYEEGKDWEIQGDIFRLSKESRIFSFEENDLIFEENRPDECFPTIDGKYSLFCEGHFFHDRQICITYKKSEGSLGFVPGFSGALLRKTLETLRHGEKLKMVLYGDSIAAGANSSGTTLTTPFLPTWGNLFAENLERHYGTKVEFVNTAVGGKDSYWGVENAQKRVGDYAPDLAVIAFGMNDHDRGDVFVENIKKIMERIRRVSKDTEFILCATTVPNKHLKGFYRYQDEYFAVLRKLQQEGTAIADFYGMQKCLQNRKRFIDMTGNNVNHPNDFLIRCHAQLLSAMLIENIQEIE